VPVRQPTLGRRQLGAELRRLRAAAGLTIERVAHHLECSDSKISRLEKGQVSARPQDIEDLLTLYGVNDLKREELLQLARQARRRPW